MADRIARKTAEADASTGCRLWLGDKTSTGRGMVWYNGKNRFVARVVWEMANGAIPPGMYVCHRCDTPLCVEVKHLFIGTPRDNALDMIAKGRDVRVRGEKHPNAKLSAASVLDVRERHARGETMSGLAREYGVNRRTIDFALSGTTWGHLRAALKPQRGGK